MKNGYPPILVNIKKRHKKQKKVKDTTEDVSDSELDL